MQAVNIPREIIEDIITLGKKHGIQNIILFGSRAPGDNRERSDIDLAISNNLSATYIFIWHQLCIHVTIQPSRTF